MVRTFAKASDLGVLVCVRVSEEQTLSYKHIKALSDRLLQPTKTSQ